MNERKERKLKVTAKNIPYAHHGERVPGIVLSGKWLLDAGFNIGDMICIQLIEEGLLIQLPGANNTMKETADVLPALK